MPRPSRDEQGERRTKGVFSLGDEMDSLWRGTRGTEGLCGASIRNKSARDRSTFRPNVDAGSGMCDIRIGKKHVLTSGNGIKHSDIQFASYPHPNEAGSQGPHLLFDRCIVTGDRMIPHAPPRFFACSRVPRPNATILLVLTFQRIVYGHPKRASNTNIANLSIVMVFFHRKAENWSFVKPCIRIGRRKAAR